ncbi:hypothetical protein PENCOP_c012G00844 [Penicillium coprophilum]|uniref:Uncharacterized protein n=1 Tax=Penicillium coprophilum TaxID=36646 RepID=A0A1V6UCQ6_9EURO|nr:hypothetical protein PENCOP_c012G00844 [Penicillium coprophilum]
MLHRIASVVASEAAAGTHFATTIVVAAEWLPGGLSLKTYFVPRRLSQKNAALGGVGRIPGAAGAYVPGESCHAWVPQHEPRGQCAEPIAATNSMLAVDNVVSEKSHLKFYFQTPHTSFASVREIVTLGGRIPVADSHLQDLRSLLLAINGIDSDFADQQEVPCPEQYDPSAIDNFVELPILLSGYLYYFDIAPGPALPSIKLYNPVRRYGPDDRALAGGIMQWMDAHGRILRAV